MGILELAVDHAEGYLEIHAHLCTQCRLRIILLHIDRELREINLERARRLRLDTGNPCCRIPLEKQLAVFAYGEGYGVPFVVNNLLEVARHVQFNSGPFNLIAFRIEHLLTHFQFLVGRSYIRLGYGIYPRVSATHGLNAFDFEYAAF